MGCLGKGLALVLILIMAISSLSLIILKSSSAQPLPQLSVPQFTIKYVNASHNDLGGYVKNETIVLTIENQTFKPIFASDASYVIQLYYNISSKASNESDWSYFPSYENLNDWTVIGSSGTNSTVITLEVAGDNAYFSGLVFPWERNVSAGETIDFRI